MARDPAGLSRRRDLLRGAAGLIALARGGQAAAAHRVRIVDSALARSAQSGGGPQGPFRASEFDMVGVFDVDWLLDSRYERLLDTMVASPGAFGAVRVFGTLNSGVREDVFPTSSGHVWPRADAPMDFSTTLDALSALTSRGLIPFLPLTFFPAAVSASPMEPPGEFGAWQALVRGFLDRLADRFGAAEIGRWWFEVWNEPNMPPFWRGDFDRYLDLYRATSEAVLASGHAIRLGGPALAYMPPREGEALMERFLDFLRREPAAKCDFLSFHRKGIWVSEEALPEVERLVAAAETTAEQALRLVPERCRSGLPIINNEADMKVGFATPYEPRLTEQFPAWLAAIMVAHDALSARYAERGLRFLAAADNANQHLVRDSFDGRRSLMTPTSAAPDDLLKLPVFAFYELLRLLGDRHGSWNAPGDAFFPHSGLFHLMTVAEDRIGALLAHYPAEGHAARPITIDHVLDDIPWPWVNLVQFRIDGAHSNAYTAAGRQMPLPVEAVAVARRIRAAQELGVAAPIRHRIRVEGGRTRLTLRLEPFATALVWVTPFDPAPPAPPPLLEAEARNGNVVLRWAPHRDGAFYAYELHRYRRGGRGTRISPMPLRAATWVDTAPAPGEYRYALRVVSASGIRSAAVRGPVIRV